MSLCNQVDDAEDRLVHLTELHQVDNTPARERVGVRRGGGFDLAHEL